MLKTLKNINQINQDMLAFVKVIHCLYNYLLQQLTYIIYIFHLKFLFTINALFKSLISHHFPFGKSTKYLHLYLKIILKKQKQQQQQQVF